MAVDVDLHREREPRLHARMAEPELAIEEVEVQEETLPPRRANGRAAGPVGQAEAAAGLDGPKDTHQAVGDPVTRRDRPRPLILPHGPLKVLVGPPRFLRHRAGMHLEALGLLQDESLQVLEQDAAPAEELLHRVRVAERQMAFEQESVEARQRPRGRGRVLREEFSHGTLRLVAMTSGEHATSSYALPSRVGPPASRRRWGGFGCGREAAL